MTKLKQIITAALSCCIVFSGCGRTAPDTDDSGVTPFNIHQYEEDTSEDGEDSPDTPEDEDSPVTTTASSSAPPVTLFTYPETTAMVTAYRAQRPAARETTASSSTTSKPAAKTTTTTKSIKTTSTTKAAVTSTAPAVQTTTAAPVTAAVTVTETTVSETSEAVTTEAETIPVTAVTTEAPAETTTAAPAPQITKVTAVQTTEAPASTQPPETTQTTAAAVSSVTSTTTVSAAVTTTVTTVTTPAQLMEQMSLEQKVCQMFMVSPEQLTGSAAVTEADAALEKALGKYPVGGLLYSTQNLVSPEQASQMIAATQDFAKESCGIGAFIAVEENGVGIYSEDTDPETALAIGSAVGKELKTLGFNVDLAPSADASMYESEPETAAEIVRNFIRGLHSQGVFAALKSLPLSDTSDASETSDAEQTDTGDLSLFSAGIIEVAEFIVLDFRYISAYGETAAGTLTGYPEYSGIIAADLRELSESSEGITTGDAAVMAVKAGADMMILPGDLPEAVKAVCDAVENGEIPLSRINESTLKLLTAKASLQLS